MFAFVHNFVASNCFDQWRHNLHLPRPEGVPGSVHLWVMHYQYQAFEISVGCAFSYYISENAMQVLQENSALLESSLFCQAHRLGLYRI